MPLEVCGILEVFSLRNVDCGIWDLGGSCWIQGRHGLTLDLLIVKEIKGQTVPFEVCGILDHGQGKVGGVKCIR